jgi:hypothetical protein
VEEGVVCRALNLERLNNIFQDICQVFHHKSFLPTFPLEVVGAGVRGRVGGEGGGGSEIKGICVRTLNRTGSR